MKQAILIILALCLIVGLYVTWMVIGPATSFDDNYRYLYIPSSNPNKETVLRLLEKDSMIKNPRIFNMLATRMDYWQQIKPGKYKIESGNSNWTILRLLRN